MPKITEEQMAMLSAKVDSMDASEVILLITKLNSTKGIRELKDEFMGHSPAMAEAPPTFQNLILSAFVAGAVCWRKVMGDITDMSDFLGEDLAAELMAGESQVLDDILAAGKAEFDELKAAKEAK